MVPDDNLGNFLDPIAKIWNQDIMHISSNKAIKARNRTASAKKERRNKIFRNELPK